eukprot:Plantae.Rhodophyta-Rhodochaete_pulchella.ctg17580.p1 GENE.Plantae.Rhodophyta-Rhodochaete_pulchella.ctg17580~~Plantae.Rhodophyta-Rhodochaete_pulchella.ctg17580.p1  ORF type:complete len:405 (+),score=38.39 Plantae.Rhodophyta-Rhodochaete_pulchella.ctg17580:380-1594(+)
MVDIPVRADAADTMEIVGELLLAERSPASELKVEKDELGLSVLVEGPGYWIQTEFPSEAGRGKSPPWVTFGRHLPGTSDLAQSEVEAIVGAYILAQKPFRGRSASGPSRSGAEQINRRDDAVRKLEELGATVLVPGTSDTRHQPDWNDLAGYSELKRRIDNTITLALQHPEIYDSITQQTRRRPETNRPKAVLFEGPPGCGKTTAAKILASQAGVYFIHVPLESIVSKWFGESEQRLSTILNTANELGNPCLIFLDEIDSIAESRDYDKHEASKRLLSVLLRHIDGFEGQQNSILIAATNRPDHLDAALMSRFDVIITFDLPDLKARAEIFALYAKQLSTEEHMELSHLSEGMSGRDLLDLCEQVEREFAGRVLRRELSDGQEASPRKDDYRSALGELGRSASA